MGILFLLVASVALLVGLIAGMLMEAHMNDAVLFLLVASVALLVGLIAGMIIEAHMNDATVDRVLRALKMHR
jgi:uncharacterized membrane protein YeaQ/YmgE (transglycosylase-associated protein family)